MKRIKLYDRVYNPLELEALQSVLESGWLTRGAITELFEVELSNYLNKKTLLVSSCTAALHLACLLAGIGRHDEVITTPFTFRATRNAILYCHARPVFVDVNGNDGCIDVNQIEAAITNKTKAIMPVHYAGNLCDKRAIKAIADKHGLYVIEDCAHAVEGMTTEFADYSCYSFYCTKNLSIGEGGAITLPDNEYYRALELSRHGAINLYESCVNLGFKYNFTDLQAAIGRIQLGELHSNLKKRRDAVKYYRDNLFVPMLTDPEGCCHLAVIKLDTINKRNELRNRLDLLDIETSVHYPMLTGLPVVRELSNTVLSLPLYPAITREQQDRVITHVNRIGDVNVG